MVYRLSIIFSAAAACLTSCSDEGSANRTEFWRGEERRHVLETRVKLAAMELEKEQDRAARSEATAAAHRSVNARRTELLARRQALDSRIDFLEGEIQRVRSEGIARIRSSRTGSDIDQLTALDGRTYLDVSIRRITDAGIEFRHRNGSARLSAPELNAEQRDFFALDTASSVAAIDRENRRALAYEHWVDRRLKQIVATPLDTGPSTPLRHSTSSRRVLAGRSRDAAPSPLDEPPRAIGTGRRVHHTTRYRYYNTYSGYCPARYYYRPPSVPIRGSAGSSTPRWGTPRTPYCP